MAKFFDVDFMKSKISKEEITNFIEGRNSKRPLTIQITIPKRPSDVPKKVEDNQNKTN